MANTYSQIYIHFVFSVQNRMSLISPKWESELYQYMIAIIDSHGHKTYAINGMPDHIHVLVSMNPKQSQSELMYHIKRSSSKWINENGFVVGKFTWQEGFGAFSYGKSQIPSITRYIENQEEHHKKLTFREEYIRFLKLFDVEYDERYICKPVE